MTFCLGTAKSASKTDMEEKELMNKGFIFIFFAHKKYFL